MSRPRLLTLCLTVICGASLKAQVSPLLSTTWNQTCNYNANCPSTGSGGACGKVFTGCGATAMAQVMKFWQFPANGWGNHSYTAGSYGLQSADYSAAAYNYAAMPNNVTAANPDVAQLMYHCGVSVDMQYSGTSSNCFFSDISAALKQYFGYSLTTHNEMKWMYSDSAWAQLIIAELDAGRPVIFSGSSHFWVVDGYHLSPALEFHMNWGWGGTYNGYYALNDLTPGSNSFPNSAIIIGLKPASAFEYTDTVEIAYNASSFNSYEISTTLTFTSVSGTSWITLDSAGGTPGYHKDYFTVPQNDSYFDRYGYIIVSNGSVTDTIVVHQAGHTYGLDLSADTLFFSYSGGAQNADIWTGVNWNLTNTTAWCTPSSASGSTSTTLTITATANPGTQRTHTYSIANVVFTRQLVVVQEASPTASITEKNQAAMWVYPNPTSGMLYFSCPANRVRVLNMQGECMLQAVQTQRVELSALPPGYYILQLTDPQGIVSYSHIIRN